MSTPTDELQAAILAYIAEMFPTAEQPHLKLTFEEHGLDSLAALQVGLRVQAEHGCRFSSAMVEDNPTVEALCQRLLEARDKSHQAHP